jgi:hypothetical protein
MTDKIRSTRAPFWTWVSDVEQQTVDDSAIAQVLRQRRKVVIECLEELLQKDASTAERNAAASAIGTLTELERKLSPQNR